MAWEPLCTRLPEELAIPRDHSAGLLLGHDSQQMPPIEIHFEQSGHVTQVAMNQRGSSEPVTYADRRRQ